MFKFTHSYESENWISGIKAAQYTMHSCYFFFIKSIKKPLKEENGKIKFKWTSLKDSLVKVSQHFLENYEKRKKRNWCISISYVYSIAI